ncbi:MAG: LLM class flavin-dependent oxidoreductase [Polyangiaceae bacterium]|nr:LLM class flavin-dependent oxidoreductase [Polyangiaceae bacterium]
MTKPRVGVVAYWKGYDRRMYLKAARLADELGYDSFWVPEAWGYDVFPLIAEMARDTRRIKLGTGIINVFSRSPGLIAMSAATLDEISGGRFLLGMGTSAHRVIEGFHGRPFDRPLTQVKDTIKVVRGLLRGDSLDQCGAELHRYRPFKLATRGPHRVPIYIAALKQKAIEAVGELADGWMPAFWPYAELHRGLASLHEGARRAGRDPSSVDVALITAAIPMGRRGATKIAKEIISFYVGGMGDFYRELLSGLGFRDECARITELYANHATRAQAKDAVPDAMVEAMTVSGDPLECRARLATLGAHGVDTPLLGLPATQSWPATAAYLHAMAPGRLPSVAQVVATGVVRAADGVVALRGR